MLLDKDAALKELGIPSEMYDDLLKMFIEEIKPRLDILKELISRGNFEEIVKAAHFIKGSAGNLRIYEIQDQAKKIEFSAREKKGLDSIGENFKKLQSSFGELEKIISK